MQRKLSCQNGKVKICYVFFSEHITSIVASMMKNCQATQRQRLVNKYTENDHEKVFNKCFKCAVS